jgi:hypothetical protein
VLGRVQVQADDILQFCGELRIAAELKRFSSDAASARVRARYGARSLR